MQKTVRDPETEVIGFHGRVHRACHGREKIGIDRVESYVEVQVPKSGLQKQKEALEKKKDELDKQGLLLNEETRKGRESVIRTLERDYSRTLSDLKEEFGRRESEFTDGIRKDLLKVIEKFGKEGGFTLVLEKQYSAILYAPASIDLTEALIKRYDADGVR